MSRMIASWLAWSTQRRMVSGRRRRCRRARTRAAEAQSSLAAALRTRSSDGEEAEGRMLGFGIERPERDTEQGGGAKQGKASARVAGG
jgi:hypothetical protein